MRETTLIEVMAEVSREAGAILSVGDAHRMLVQADAHLDAAFRGRGAARRNAIKSAAAALLRALYAHDAEAASAYNPGPEGA